MRDFPFDSQYRAHRGALAYAHQDGEVPILEHLSPRAWLEMNPRDAKQLGLRSHDRVDVVSQRGRVRGIELRLTEIIGAGTGVHAVSFFRNQCE